MPFSTNSYIVIQYLSVDKLYKDQLAELPAILDNFYTSTRVSQVITEGWRSGVVGSHEVAGFFMCRSRTLPDGLT